jgi:hypothetical protein
MFILAGFFVCAAHVYGINYYITTEPSQPQVGDAVSVTILLPGVKAAGVKAPEPAAAFGLELESISVSPTIDMPAGEDATFGTRVIYVFRARDYGDLRVPSLTIDIPEGPVKIRSVTIAVLSVPGAPVRAPYAWKAPSHVMRWQCFSASLEARAPGAAPLTASSLPASPGLALESHGERAFVGMALEEGALSFPSVSTPEGAVAADSRILQVTPAPEGIASSRAIGAFTAQLVKPGKPQLIAGETFTARVEVRGRGNLPILEAPLFTVSGTKIGASDFVSTFPVSDIRIVNGAYEGMAGRVLVFVPGQPGIYIVQAEPFAFWSIETGKIEMIRFPQIRVTVDPALASPEEGLTADPSLTKALNVFAARPGELGAIASLALQGDSAAALKALGVASDPWALYLKGLILLRADRTLEALASLAAAERKNRFLPGLQKSLLLCEKAMGSIPRVRDGLPEPRVFLVPASVLLALALAALVLFQASSAHKKAVYRFFMVTLAILALFLLTMGALSALERRTAYAVATGGQAYSVPSAAGTAVSGGFQGYSGRVAVSSGGWTLIKFPDGRSAWFPEGTCILY